MEMMGPPLPSSAASRGVERGATPPPPTGTRHRDCRKLGEVRMRRKAALIRSRDRLYGSAPPLGLAGRAPHSLWCCSSLGELYAGRSADSRLSEASRGGRGGGGRSCQGRAPPGRGRGGLLGCSRAPPARGRQLPCKKWGPPKAIHPTPALRGAADGGLILSPPGEEGQGVPSSFRGSPACSPSPSPTSAR